MGGFFDVIGQAHGALKRVDRMGQALYRAGEAIPGAGWDIVRSPFVSDPNLDGFWHTLIGRPVARGGDIAMNLIGPQGVLGEAVGAAPPLVRQGGNYIVKPANDISNNLYRNVISEPISTLITYGSLIQEEDRWHDPSSIMGRAANMFDPNVMKEAYALAQHRSPGQAEALSLANTDILDPTELKNFEGTDFYHFASGAFDIYMRWELDPQVLASKGYHLFRETQSLVRDVNAAEGVVRTEGQRANWVNAQKAEADRYTKLANDAASAGLQDQANLLIKNRDRIVQGISNVVPDWTSHLYTEPLGIDHWRANGLTDEVSAWYKRTQQSWDDLQATRKVYARTGALHSKGDVADLTARQMADWTQERMTDLNERLTRTEYPRQLVGHDASGLPIFASGAPPEPNPNWPKNLRSMPEEGFHKEGPMVNGPSGTKLSATEAAGAPHPLMQYDAIKDAWVLPEGVNIPSRVAGKTIGLKPFDPAMWPRMGLQEMHPRALLEAADFGPGVKYTMNPDLVSFEATPRNYVPQGFEPENLAHVAHDPNLVGRDLVDRQWTKANGVIPDSLLGSIGSRNSQLAIEGVGAPAAKVVDHTIGRHQSLVAVTVGTEQDPSILRATKKINSHPEIHTPSVPVMTEAHAEQFVNNTRRFLESAASIRDQLKSLPTDYTQYEAAIEDELSKLRPATGVLEKLRHEFPEDTWTGSMVQKKRYAERAYELAQQNAGGATVTIDFNKLLTPEMIQTHPVNAGQLANSESRITSPLAWDATANKYVPQNSRWDVHGDIRVKDPGLIPEANWKPGSGRQILSQLDIDAVTADRMTRMGITTSTPWAKVKADMMGLLHNPDPQALGDETMGRTIATHSKLAEEVNPQITPGGSPVARGEDLIEPTVTPWTVPDKLYHTTGFANLIEATGRIEARLSGGFGTDPYNLKFPGVSLSGEAASATINERWLREVVGPMAQDLGANPTEREVVNWFNTHLDDLMGDESAKKTWMQIYGHDLEQRGAIRSGSNYEPVLNAFSHHWVESHGYLDGPEYMVNVSDAQIAKIHPANVKTYIIDGTDLVGAPGDIRNPYGGSEYRYYGDIPIVGKGVSQGGEAVWSQDIALGQEAQQLREEQIAMGEAYDTTKDKDYLRMSQTLDSESVAKEQESVRVKWAYDHNNPPPKTQEQIWKATAKFRDKYVPHDAHGTLWAYALASAKDSNQMDLVQRIFLGDAKAISEIDISNILLRKTMQDYAAQMTLIRGKLNAMEEMDIINALGESMTEYYSGKMKDLQLMVDQTAKELRLNQRIIDGFGTMKSVPVRTWRNTLRSDVFNSELFQISPWTKPISIVKNTFTRNLPHNMLNPYDETSDIQFHRMMQQGGMEPGKAMEWRGKYIAAAPEDRAQIVNEVDAHLVQRRLISSGLTRDQINDLMKVSTNQRQKAAALMNRQQYDAIPSEAVVREASNIIGQRYRVIEDANDIVVAPHWAETETNNTIFMTNFRRLDKALGPVNQWKQRYAGLRYAIDVPKHLMDQVQQVWRGAVLFRPAWPMRVISEAQVIAASKVGVLATLAGSWDGFKNLTDYTMRSLGYKVDDIIPQLGDNTDSVVHQMENLPVRTATDQFLARVQQAGDEVDKLKYIDDQLTDAKLTLRQRQIRELDLRTLNESTINPNTQRLYQDATLRYEQAEKNRMFWYKQHEQARLAYFRAPSGETRAAYDKAMVALDDADILMAERKAQRVTAAEAAVNSRDQTTHANWKAAKSDLDEATKAVTIIEGQRQTQLARASTVSGMARDLMPGAEQLGADAEQTAEGIVNPPVQPGPAKPTRSATRMGAVGGAIVGGVIGGPAGAAVGAGFGTVLMQQLAKLEARGGDQLGLSSYRVQNAFGTAGDKAAVMQAAVSQQGQMYEFLDKQTKELIDGLEFDPHSYRTVTFDDPAHGISWAKAMRNIQQDTMGQMILKAGKRVEEEPEAVESEIMKWMLETPEGRAYAARIPQRAGWEPEWIQQSMGQVERYTKNFDPQLMAKLEKGQAMPAMLDHIDPVQRPSVHGPELAEILGNGVGSKLSRFFDKAIRALGTTPTDHLSRFPFFNATYEAEIGRMLEGQPAGRIKEAQLRIIEDKAREYALNQVRVQLHDLAERSEFAEMTKFFMPFFGAWQQIITRWTRMAIDNPMYAARAIQVWGAPNKVPGLMVTDETTGEQYIQFRLPEAAKALIGHGPLSSALDSEGYVRFNKGSISMVASGMPGFGPFVNLAVSQIAKARPDATNALKSLMPFGVSDSTLDPFLPAAARRLVSIQKGPDDAAFASSYHQILVTRVTDIMDGRDRKWGPDDLNNPEVRDQLFKEVDEETHKLYAIRFASSLLSPVPIQFESIYKPYIDEYRALRALNPDTADQLFMSKHGDDMVYLTQAVTQTNNGVPPTMHGAEAEQKFGKLISEFPDYGSVIVGPDAGGESAKFMAQVYNSQLTTAVAPGSDTMQRERLSPLEQLTAPQVRLGWQEFSRYMDKIDAYMIQNGFKTYGQAPNMREFKNEVVKYLADKYPAWADEYFVRDQRKWDKRIEAFTAMTQEPGLQDRPDMQGVAQYLRYRAGVMQVLQARAAGGGSADIFAQSNSDVYDFWAEARMTLKDQNLQFADLYNRYLDRDPLTIDPILGSSE